MKSAISANTRATLNIDERIVTDLIMACRAVAAKLDTLPALA
jgi:hypothetical protein